MSEYGKNIRAAREAQGLSQAELAKKCDLKASAISNYETDFSKPDLDKLVTLCEVLDTTPEFILGLNTETSKEYTPEEKNFIRDLRDLDEDRRSIVRQELDKQLEIVNQSGDGYRVVTPHEIQKPVFLTKDDPDYNEMKAACKTLKALQARRNVPNEDITKFLWSIGYGKNIRLADIIQLFSFGRKIPNRQLYNRIQAYLEGRYNISIEGED